jgi:hypothetical protein
MSSMPSQRKRLVRWIAMGLLAAMAVLVGAGLVIAHRAASVLKSRVIATLGASFHGRVDLEKLNVVALHGFAVTGDNLRIYEPENLVAAGVTQPVILLKHFAFRAPLRGLFRRPMQVGSVEIDGLEIDIPPAARRPRESFPGASRLHGQMEIVVDKIVCDHSRLVIGNSHPEKEPKIFVLRHVELYNVGGGQPWRYQVVLTNAIPRGEIQATGRFGPWQIDSPGDTALNGNYTFQHAQLSTINGLGGILSSTGYFQGQLNRIAVDGATETPDFSLDTANHPLPLHTRFHAIVDGTTGDTLLEPVQATLRNSRFTASGAVIDIKGRGHVIDLNVDVPTGRLQDFLDLVVRTEPAVLTATIGAKARLHIRAGKEKVGQRLRVQGRFTLRSMHFTNPELQDKVDMISFRARGEPEKAKPGAQDVNAGMRGDFTLQQGTIEFHRLLSLSRMVQSRWASLALKAVSPLFRRPGGGADIPVRISGTRSAPKFGIDVLGRHAHGDKSL